jgi:hypothetical protein
MKRDSSLTIIRMNWPRSGTCRSNSFSTAMQ